MIIHPSIKFISRQKSIATMLALEKHLPTRLYMHQVYKDN